MKGAKKMTEESVIMQKVEEVKKRKMNSEETSKMLASFYCIFKWEEIFRNDYDGD